MRLHFQLYFQGWPDIKFWEKKKVDGWVETDTEGRGESSCGKVFTLQAQQPEFDPPQAQVKKPGMVVCDWKSSAAQASKSDPCGSPASQSRPS